MILEICCGDIDSVGAALTGGAGRIEPVSYTHLRAHETSV